LAAGRSPEAYREIDLALAAQPGQLEVAIELVPALEQCGQRGEADRLFERVFGPSAQFCAEYPRSPWGHNQLAWLTARCRRQLDQGLEHAQKAVALAPAEPSYLDTLAEVRFQRGDRTGAIEMMKKCVSLDPKTEYFRKQLRRFKAGDRTAEVPDQGDS
jgi:tetratricopeptide (TPR) repeat protein